MSDTEIRTLNEISGRLGRLEALHEAGARATNELTANINRLVDKLDESNDIAREADQRAKAAHHRIDEVKADSDKKWTGVQEDIEWLWRTVLAAVITGAIGGAAALVWSGIGG